MLDLSYWLRPDVVNTLFLTESDIRLAENRSFANLFGSVVARTSVGKCDLTISCGDEMEYLVPPEK